LAVASAGAVAALFVLHLSRPHISGHHSSIARSNDRLTVLTEADRLSWRANWDAAGPLYERAEALFRAAGDKRNEIHARVGRIRARSWSTSWEDVSQTLGDQLKDPVVKTDPRLRLWCLAAKGYTDLDLDSASSKRAWTEALQIANSLGEDQWAARASGELGIIAFLEGNTTSAVSLVGRAVLSAYRTGDIGSQIRLLSMLGNGFNEEHRFSEALSFFQRAISTAEKAPDAGFPFMAYEGEARALAGLGEPEQAKQMLKKALSVALLQNRRTEMADILLVLGEVALATHDTQNAKAYFEQAGQISQGISFYRTLAQAMFDLSDVERSSGDLSGASRALKIGLQASRRLGDRYYLPRDLTALAEIKIAQHKTREADRLFEEAEDILDAIIVNQHSLYESAARAGSMSETYLDHFKLARNRGNTARAFQVLERVRGRIAASRLYARSKSQSESPAAAALEARIAGVQLSLLRTDDPRQRPALLDRLLEYERNLAFETNEAGIKRQEMLAKNPSLKTVQAMLGRDEVLVEYVLDEPNAFCIAVTREAAKIMVLPAGAKHIQDLTKSFLRELESRNSGAQFAGQLYNILLSEPLGAFHKSRLLISPDGVLHLLPFEALRDGAGELLVRSKVVSYTPSASVLQALRTQRPQTVASLPLLAVGDVDYRFTRLPSRGTQRSLTAAILRGLATLSGSHLENLPASRDEVLSIGRILGGDTQLLLGRDATESRFKALALSDFRVIHLAVHAVTDPQYPDRAALILGSDPKTPDDGLLQVREIVRLPLNADLVTLSACDTGVGTVEGQAGVVSLEQAFLMSGARAVAASLWKVEDRPTTTLMKGFYVHLAQHEDKASALAHAKLDLLERYGELSPYYWAGFVMVGEGSEAIPFDD